MHTLILRGARCTNQQKHKRSTDTQKCQPADKEQKGRPSLTNKIINTYQHLAYKTHKANQTNKELLTPIST